MTTDLRDRMAAEVDHLEPLPDLVPATVILGRGRLRRRRMGWGAALAAAAALVGTVAVGRGPGEQVAPDPTPIATRPPAAPQPTASIAPEVRERYPQEARIVDCLAARGFSASLLRDGAIFHESGDVRVEGDYDAARDACMLEVTGTLTGLLPEDYTAADWRSLRRQEQDAAECLRAHGFEIPVVPALGEIKQSYQTKHPWRAYSFVPIEELGQSEWMDLNWDCPQPRL